MKKNLLSCHFNVFKSSKLLSKCEILTKGSHSCQIDDQRAQTHKIVLQIVGIQIRDYDQHLYTNLPHTILLKVHEI